MINKYIRAYLRASTHEQDVNRAKKEMLEFAEKNNFSICKFYTENASGASLNRPVLHELLNDANAHDVLLIESVDRLTRLPYKQWQKLYLLIQEKQIDIAVKDIPSTHPVLLNRALTPMELILNKFLIEVFASNANGEYETKRKRQAQGIAKAKIAGKYKGRKANTDKYKTIIKLIEADLTVREIKDNLKCSQDTIKRAKDWGKEQGLFNKEKRQK